MKIVFMGTPDIAKECLSAIYDAGYEIEAVVTNPDKPSGRGMKMEMSPVKEFALEKNLKIYQPLKVRKNEEFLSEIRNIHPDIIVVVAYGKILPQELLDIPTYGAINVHGSLLPKLRGAAPIQWAVLNGDKETGITTMFMDAGMDTGDMILKEKVAIGENETTGELWEEMSKVGAQLIVKTIAKLDDVLPKLPEDYTFEDIKQLMGATKQDDSEATLAPMLDKEMSKINWNESASKIHNLVRGLNPFMGTFTFLPDGKKIKIWKTVVSDGSGKPGEIIVSDKKQGLKIMTGDKAIDVLEIQGENSKKMDIKSFLNGNTIEVGTILE